jgi:hypothetical protein
MVRIGTGRLAPWQRQQHHAFAVMVRTEDRWKFAGIRTKRAKP